MLTQPDQVIQELIHVKKLSLSVETLLVHMSHQNRSSYFVPAIFDISLRRSFEDQELG